MVEMHLCRLAEKSMGHRRLHAAVDVVPAERQSVVCHLRVQGVDLAVLVETFPALMQTDCFQVLPSGEEFPFPALMKTDCSQVLEYQLVETA
jgi:hypothetical protein